MRCSETIQFPPATTQKFTADEILSLREGLIFVPVSENQEALDAFLLLHSILYILQFTVGQNPDIKLGFVKVLQKCQNIPQLEEWKFVSLIPPGTMLPLCPEPKSELHGLRKLNPYLAELNLQPYLNACFILLSTCYVLGTIYSNVSWNVEKTFTASESNTRPIISRSMHLRHISRRV